MNSQFSSASPNDVPAIRGPVLYGIWLSWGLLYVGQTREAQRRLRDLPVGEGRHLATTFPAEIWRRVVVVPWGTLREVGGRAPDVPIEVVGLALEHRLQAWAHPLVNEERRRRDGGWRGVTWNTSRSRGAVAAPLVDELFAAVVARWQEGAESSVPILRRDLRVVFPRRILESVGGDPEEEGRSH